MNDMSSAFFLCEGLLNGPFFTFATFAMLLVGLFACTAQPISIFQNEEGRTNEADLSPDRMKYGAAATGFLVFLHFGQLSSAKRYLKESSGGETTFWDKNTLDGVRLLYTFWSPFTATLFFLGVEIP